MINLKKFRNYSLYYNNLESMEQTLDEIFNQHVYNSYMTFDNDEPFIIDCGSNIGISTLFFKEKYPESDILCFEPDPNAYSLLKKNIIKNRLSKVKTFNCALSSKEGITDFFGQISVNNPDSRGNSIISSWGIQRKVSNQIKVNSVLLSNYVSREVDFLKLDIEGAEQQVLLNLESQNKLNLIKNISIEVHQTKNMLDINNLNTILNLLNRNNYIVNFFEKDILSFLPTEINDWVKKEQPKFFIVNAFKNS